MRRRILLMLLGTLLIGCGPVRTPANVTPTASSTARPTRLPTATPYPTPVPSYSGPHPPATANLGDTWLRPRDGMIMVYVPGGTFQMGSDRDDHGARDDEFPKHSVTVDGFWMDLTEVTNARFAPFLNEHGNSDIGVLDMPLMEWREGYCRINKVGDRWVPSPAGVDHPVVMVNWHGAAAYCAWVGGRLPTEAEWEYAARGAQGSLHPWGNEEPNCERANFGSCVRSTCPVFDYPDSASWCGVLNMSGTAWEWTADWYGPYVIGAQENPSGPDTGEFKVLRGGGWHATEQQARATYRLHEQPFSHIGCVGFRCVVDGGK